MAYARRTCLAVAYNREVCIIASRDDFQFQLYIFHFGWYHNCFFSYTNVFNDLVFRCKTSQLFYVCGMRQQVAIKGVLYRSICAT